MDIRKIFNLGRLSQFPISRCRKRFPCRRWEAFKFREEDLRLYKCRELNRKR
jgi:hypothetical protein